MFSRSVTAGDECVACCCDISSGAADTARGAVSTAANMATDAITARRVAADGVASVACSRTTSARASVNAASDITASRAAMSKYRARTRLTATSSSHALAAYAPIRGAAQRIATPTAISTMPTTARKLLADTGSILDANGLMYAGQCARILKNLS